MKGYSERVHCFEEEIAALRRRITDFEEREIDERKQSELAVRERESQYRGIFDAVSDGLLIIDLKGFVVEANPEACNMHGYTYQELTSLHITDLVHRDYHNQGEYFAAQMTMKKDAQAESVHVLKDGRTVSVDSKAVQFKYRGADHILCIFRDNTKQKKAEQALKESEQALRLLSSKLLSVQENEKAWIAQELHDSFGQTLTAIKFGVEHAVQQVQTDSSPLATRTLRAVIPMIQHAVEETRKMSMELRPTILDSLGIVPTIKWFVQEFKKVHPDIRSRLDISIPENDVSKPLKLTVYRILQEATNNIAKHSNATFVRISLKKTSKGIEFVVKDNGKGFDARKVPTDENLGIGIGIGIPSMAERARQSGGQLTIDSSSEEGTVVRVLWPMGGEDVLESFGE